MLTPAPGALMPPSPAFCPPLAFHSRTAHPFSPPLAMAPHHAIMPPCRLSSALTFPVYMPISSPGPGAPGGNAVQCVLASLQLAWGAALSKCSVNTGWWKDRRTGKGRNEQQHSKIRLGETASVGGQRSEASGKAATGGKGRDAEGRGYASKRSRK